MRILVFCGVLLLIALPTSLHSLQSQPQTNTPSFTDDGKLRFPENYRDWVWLSSGLGMTYGPLAQGRGSDNPSFDNVFVSPEAYRQFLQTGKWPDKTMLVLEVRASATEGSINKAGRFQRNVLGVEVEVKDEKRFTGSWAFFPFGQPGAGKTSQALPGTAECYSCHSQNGAVDNTFVQFYPTLAPVAQSKGTFKQK